MVLVTSNKVDFDRVVSGECNGSCDILLYKLLINLDERRFYFCVNIDSIDGQKYYALESPVLVQDCCLH